MVGLSCGLAMQFLDNGIKLIFCLDERIKFNFWARIKLTMAKIGMQFKLMFRIAIK